MNAYRIAIVTIFPVLVSIGCFEDPTRSHPLDPLGENFLDEGGVAVQATNFYPPRAGLADINVRVSPGAISGKTDDAGRFAVGGLSSGMYDVSLEQQGYATVDTLVEIVAGEIVQLELAMAGLPTFTRFEANSLHVSRWFPPPEELFSIEILAEVDDSDGIADLDSLWVEIEEFGFSEPLIFQVEPGTYVHTISSNDFSFSLGALLGHEIRLRARDRSGASSISAPEMVVRVIDETPLALEPQELVLVTDAQPVFSWEPVTLEFPFTYRIDIFQVNQNIQSTIRTIEGISSSSTTFTLEDPLSMGDYFWTVSVVDEFGNRSRSREAGFRIP